MPGLTDAHTHASGRVPQVLRGAEEVLPGTAAHFLQAELRDYLRHRRDDHPGHRARRAWRRRRRGRRCAMARSAVPAC